MLWVSIQFLLHSCLLNHYVEFTINRAMPPQRSAPANAATEWRIGPGIRGGPAVVLIAPRLVQRFFVLPRLFFVAWFLASQAVTASGSGNPAPLGSKTFCVAQKNLCAVLSLTRFAVGSALSIDSGLRAPPDSPATPPGATAGGPAPPESRRSGRRSAPHTIRLLFWGGFFFLPPAMFCAGESAWGKDVNLFFVPAPLLPPITGAKPPQ